MRSLVPILAITTTVLIATGFLLVLRDAWSLARRRSFAEARRLRGISAPTGLVLGLGALSMVGLVTALIVIPADG